MCVGAGESGKSTIVKQMRIIHNDGYSHAERMQMIMSIHGNILNSIKAITKAMEALKIELDDPEKCEDALAYVTNAQEEHGFKYDAEFFDNVIMLWNDKGVKSCFRRSNEYQLIDSAE